MSYQLHLAKEYCVFTFHSTQHALKAEKVLGNNSLDFIIIPTPREISASCGLSIKAFKEDYQAILDLLSKNQVQFAGTYQLNKQSKGNLITKLETKEL